MLSQKTTFEGYDQNMVGLNFKDFLDLEKANTILGKSKLIGKEICMVLRSHIEFFNAHKVIMIKYAKKCEMSPNMNCFECEDDKACRNCFKRIT